MLPMLHNPLPDPGPATSAPEQNRFLFPSNYGIISMFLKAFQEAFL